jgi:glycosyltransferase involved in cell wall biosynthesis
MAVGRLFEQKRFDRLIDAFALIAYKYPEWRLEIFGNGPLENKLLAQSNKHKLSNRILIHPPTHSIYDEYQCSQFMVLSSDYEGFGLVIAEAMACGLPVVSTNCPYGPSEIIEDKVTGLLTKLNVQDLADKMEWMITHPKERTLMGRQAHQSAGRYAQDVLMPQWLKAYQL